MKVLIVDDHAVNRRLLKAYFEGERVVVLEAGDGREGLAQLELERPTVIVSDVLMPNMDGYSFCRAVRENPQYDDIPLVVLTGSFASPADESMARQCGADAFIKKPASSATVLQEVEDVIRRRTGTPAVRPALSEKEVLKEYSEELVHQLESNHASMADRADRLAASEDKFRQLMENLHQVFFLLSPDGATAHYASPAYETVWESTCLAATTAEGRYAWLGAVPPEDRERAKARLAAGGRQELEFRLDRPEGGARWVSLRTFPVFGPGGEVVRLSAIAEDVTELKKAETQMRLAQKMEDVGELAGGVAHHFNNLLTVILGLSDAMLRRLPAEHPLRGDLTEIKNAGRNAAHLTGQLLAFARRQRVEPRGVDLREVVATAERMLRPVLREDIELFVTPSPEPSPVRIDPLQMEQVLLNLCFNARDAMPGGGRLTLGVKNVSWAEERLIDGRRFPPGDYASFFVEDDGTGMSDDVKRHLFEPFFTTKAAKGTGLGLATCHGIVQQSEGFIAVSSGAGRGTRFDVFLPRLAGEVPAFNDAGALEFNVGGSETVLLVEDEELLRRLVGRSLREFGYTVLEAAGPMEAMKFLAEDGGRRIKLLLTDLIMPGGNGQRLAAEARRDRSDLRVIVSSGYAEEALTPAGTGSGASTFLRKPYTIDELARTVRRVLDAPIG